MPRHRAFIINGGSLSDIFDQLVGRRRDPLAELLSELAGEADDSQAYETIDEMIMRPEILKMEPVTSRSIMHLTPDVIWIGPEGFRPEHPHHNFLIRHPEKPDRWRLWSICPGHSSLRSFHIKGTADPVEAVRRSNILLDIGLGLLTNDKEFHLDRQDAEHTGVRTAPEAPKPATE